MNQKVEYRDLQAAIVKLGLSVKAYIDKPAQKEFVTLRKELVDFSKLAGEQFHPTELPENSSWVQKKAKDQTNAKT